MKSTPVTRFGSLALCAAVGAGAAGSALAQPLTPAQSLLDQSFVINAGAFLVQTDLKASLNGQSVNNPEIDFDETFGKANDQTRIRADALWRITPKHHLTFMYFDNSTSRTKVLDRDVNWGDNLYKVGATVTSDMKFKVGALSYEYAFMRDPNYEVAANIGLHVSDLTLGLRGDATVTDASGTRPVSGAVQSNSMTAPLPVIGLRGAWVVTPNLVLDAQAQFFKVKVDEVDGSWSDLRANATWMFNKTFGLGLGYDRFYNRVDVTKTGFNGKVKMGYSGLQLFGTVAF
jgi:hypothetical protein